MPPKRRQREEVDDEQPEPAKEQQQQPFVLPRLGLGTFRLKGAACESAVAMCLQKGVRLIDTANSYNNHEAIRNGIKKSGVALADVVITTKISRDQLSGADAAANVKKAVANETTLLGKKPDVVLLHFPGTANTNVASPLHKQARLAAWRQLLAEKAAGTVTGLVGVSNFTVAHLEELRAAGLALPGVCQNEFHPYCREQPLRAFCAEHKIVFQPYTSLGRSLVPPKSLYGNLEFPADPKIHPRVADDKTVKEVAKTLGVSPELLLLRYSIEKTGHAIPKMSTEAHIDENLKAVDDALWAELATKKPDWVKALDEIKVPLKGKDTVRYAYQPAKLAIQ